MNSCLFMIFQNFDVKPRQQQLHIYSHKKVGHKKLEQNQSSKKRIKVLNFTLLLIVLLVLAPLHLLLDHLHLLLHLLAPQRQLPHLRALLQLASQLLWKLTCRRSQKTELKVKSHLLAASQPQRSEQLSRAGSSCLCSGVLLSHTEPEAAKLKEKSKSVIKVANTTNYCFHE